MTAGRARRILRLAATAGQVCLLIAIALAVPAVAAAQPYVGTSAPHRGSFEAGGGVSWTGGYDAGSAIATLTRPGSAMPLTLFSESARMLAATGGVARLGVFLGRRVSAEATFEFSRPILRAHVTSDFESAADADIDASVTSYLGGASLLYHVGEGRFVPFVSGGGGYLRQLHEENAELQTGAEVHAGGGLKYRLGAGAHRFGLRVDAGLSARSKAIAFEQKRRMVPSLSVGLSYQF